jgi:RHS repeat-associated protein
MLQENKINDYSDKFPGKDKTQAQQKRYRYTGKERDDSSGLSYYGARYLTPWLVRWISPDSVGALGAFLPPYFKLPHVVIEPSALRAAKARSFE